MCLPEGLEDTPLFICTKISWYEILKDSKILRNIKNSNLRAGLGINGGAILSRGAPFFPINCTFGDGYGLAFVLKYERAPGTDQREIKINKKKLARNHLSSSNSCKSLVI